MDAENSPESPPDSAGYHVLRDVPVAQLTASCGQVLAMLRAGKFEYADAVIVTDEERHVLGVLSTGEVASHDADTPVSHVMHREPGVAGFDLDQEHVASLAIRNVLGIVPVVDRDRKLLGLVPPHALLAVLRHEHVEDLHRLTGMLRENEIARAAIEDPPFRRAYRRLPWLLVGWAGSALVAIVMASFESVLQTRAAVVLFLPGIIYLSDAVGTQSEAIAVRGLSFGHVRIRYLLAGELCTGALIGAVLAAVSALAVWLVLGDAWLSLAVGTALFAAGSIASGVGLLFPWIFHRFGFDPAYGSGPLATVAQNVLSLLIYFGTVSAFLRHST